MAPVPAMGFMELLLVVVLGGGLGVPLGVPPQQPDPMLANIAPDQCLYYTAWVGMAEPDASSANETERLLAEPELKAFVAELEKFAQQAVAKMGERRAPLDQAITASLPALTKALMTHPTVLYIESITPQPGGVDARGALVTNLGPEAAQVKETLQRIRQQVPPRVLQEVNVAGVSGVRLQLQPNVPAVTIGFREQYLIVALGDKSFEGVMERTKRSTPPQWLMQAVADIKLPPRPSTLAYLNLQAIVQMASGLGGPQVQSTLDTLGLAGLQRVVSTSGLDETGFVSRTRLVAATTDRGLFGALSDKPLDVQEVAGIPADASMAAALRLDLAHTVKQVLELARELEPSGVDEFEANLAQVEQRLGFSLQGDLLPSLGDVWTIHAAPSGGGLMAGWTLAISVRDKERLASVHEKLLQVVRAELAQAPPDQAPNIRQFDVAGHAAYTLEVKAREFFVAPTWCLTDSQLVVTLFPQALKAYLAPRAAQSALIDQPAVAALWGPDGGPCAFSYQDTRGQFLTFYPLLQIGAQYVAQQLAREGLEVNMSALPSSAAIAPHLLPTLCTARKTADGFELTSHSTLPGMNAGASAPVLVALLLPAVQASRDAARRVQSMNNMKQIGLSMHNYHDVYKAFPPAYSVDKAGQPLLSWRVHVLPFLEQQPLYEQFHLDEPWDSEHNKKLIELMPPTYRSPNSVAEAGKTVYLGNAGKDGVFVPAKEPEPARPLGTSFRHITDGTSNTIMVVEAADAAAVIWTKPDDFVPNAENPLKGLLGARLGGFIALLCDGSVRFISESVDKGVLKALFTAGGGEAVNTY